MRVLGIGWGEDEELAEGKVVIKMNPDLWMNLMNSDTPARLVEERALEELKITWGYDDIELQNVDDDSVFHESADKEFTRALRMWKHKGRIPRTLKIQFGQPATRQSGNTVVKQPPSDVYN